MNTLSDANTPQSMQECSTLEAQEDEVKRGNIWTRSIKAATTSHNTEVLDDECDKILARALDEAKPENHTTLATLAKNYASVKLSPAYPLCRDIFCHWLTEGQTRDGLTISGTHNFTVQEDATFSVFLSKLSEQLHVAPSGSLRTVILSAKSRIEYKHKNGFLRPRHKVLATFLGRLRLLHFTPNEVISLLVANTLNIARPPGFNNSDTPNINDEQRKSLLPPSLQVQRGNLDLDRLEDNHIHLTWLRKAPKFTADLDVYIWEQHKALPAAQFADIRLYPCNGVDEARLIITFQHTSSMKKFIEFRTNLSWYPQQSVADGQVWSVQSEMFFSTSSIFQVIISETTKFLQESSIELEKLVSIRYHVHNPEIDTNEE